MPTAPAPRPRIARIYERLDRAELSGAGDDLSLSEDDVALASPDRSRLAFGIYSREGLERALTAYGSLKRLQSRGLGPLELQLQLEDPFHPRIVIWATRFQRAAVDLTLSTVTGAAAGLPEAHERTRLLWIDGIVLQHPGRQFDWGRPPLPGQEFPGLALLPEIVELLVLMARRTQCEGLALVPKSFHAAVIYERFFRFVDGRAQGRLQALRSAARLRPLWLLAWAVALGCVRSPDGPYRFEPSPMLCPLSEALAEVFAAERYLGDLERLEHTRFSFDWALLRERFPWSKMPSVPPPARVRRVLSVD